MHGSEALREEHDAAHVCSPAPIELVSADVRQPAV